MRVLSQPCASRFGKMELIVLLVHPSRSYLALNTILALYVALVEKSTIYEGKRRTIASRVSRRDLSAHSEHHGNRAHILCPCRVVQKRRRVHGRV